jgi:hypothetical protein
MEDCDLTDAGGSFVTAVSGAARIDSTLSFCLIHGGHLDMTVLGGCRWTRWAWGAPSRMIASAKRCNSAASWCVSIRRR